MCGLAAHKRQAKNQLRSRLRISRNNELIHFASARLRLNDLIEQKHMFCRLHS